MTIILILIIAFIVFLILKPYFIKYDTIIAFSGGLGSGKSYLSVKYALKLLKVQRRKVFFHNHFKRYLKKVFKPLKPIQRKIEKPLLYSSIPVRISKKEYSTILTERHLLLVDKMREKSIVFIDEIGSFASQFKYKIPNIEDNFDEFVRFFRHYLKGGYLVCNDQCSENIVLQVRRRINTIMNLMHFRRFLFFFYVVKIRNIHISEEIKTIEETHTESAYSKKYGFAFLIRKYDTYCYSERYNTTLKCDDLCYNKLKKNQLLKMPNEKYIKQVSDFD